MQDAIGIVKRQVERRAADQGRQPGHRLGLRTTLGIDDLEQAREHLLRERVTDLQGMPCSSKQAQASTSSTVNRFRTSSLASYEERARPDPLDAQASLAPPHRLASRGVTTVSRDRAQVTSVVISGPNFKGTRVLIGSKYSEAATADIEFRRRRHEISLHLVSDSIRFDSAVAKCQLLQVCATVNVNSQHGSGVPDFAGSATGTGRSRPSAGRTRPP